MIGEAIYTTKSAIRTIGEAIYLTYSAIRMIGEAICTTESAIHDWSSYSHDRICDSQD